MMRKIRVMRFMGVVREPTVFRLAGQNTVARCLFASPFWSPSSNIHSTFAPFAGENRYNVQRPRRTFAALRTRAATQSRHVSFVGTLVGGGKTRGRQDGACRRHLRTPWGNKNARMKEKARAIFVCRIDEKRRPGCGLVGCLATGGRSRRSGGVPGGYVVESPPYSVAVADGSIARLQFQATGGSIQSCWEWGLGKS